VQAPPIVISPPVQTVERTEYDTQRVPTVNRDLDHLQEAINRVVRVTPNLEPHARRIRSVYDQLRGGTSSQPVLTVSNPPAKISAKSPITVGWQDPQSADASA